MSAYNALNAAVFSQLSGGTALVSALGGTAIYYLQAPDHAPRPFVVWEWVPGIGDENKSPHRAKNNIMLVRSFADSPEQAGTIDYLVDQRLHLQTLTVSGWYNIWTARETEIALTDNPPDGVKSYMAGAQYRVRIAK